MFKAGVRVLLCIIGRDEHIGLPLYRSDKRGSEGFLGKNAMNGRPQTPLDSQISLLPSNCFVDM